jgi:hypothetical protein
VVDQLAQSVYQVRLDTEEETKGVAELLTEISSTFSGDDVHLGGRSLMVWREEQRGIAELMRSDETSEALVTIGFATFVDIYDARLSSWFAELESGLRAPGLAQHGRLAELQRLLATLIGVLQQGRTGEASGSEAVQQRPHGLGHRVPGLNRIG